jgi:16S rRNA (cytidine1402-2'-O)-methyltransferase
MSSLFIVSTPIGNLGDFTHRAVEVLSSVARILTEDTRRTGILCQRYGIATPRVSLHEHNERARVAAVLRWLGTGEDLALVSDAGTPLISDPGARLVRAVLDAGHDVVPVPGPSAILAALVASGIEPEPFAFFGFPPRGGKAREAWLDRVAELSFTAVFYEAPSRLTTLLTDLGSKCGPDRAVTVARELTKLHETFVRGTLAEVTAYYENTSLRGEIVVVLAGAPEQPGPAEADTRALARQLLAEGRKPSVAARELVRQLGIPRNQAYEIALAVAAEGGGEPQ